MGKLCGHIIECDWHGWQFDVKGTGFEGALRIELDWVPADGEPEPLTPRAPSKDTVPA